MKNKINFIFLLEIIGVIALLVVAGTFLMTASKSDFGSQSQSQSRILDTATTSVGPTGVVTIASDRTNCAGILVSTVDKPVTLSFDETNPTATVGHLLASSTNNYFSAENYGCGDIKAFGLTASSTITISEFIW